MRLLFLRDTDVTEHGAGPAFKRDQVADLNVASAVHWKNLGAAVDAPPEPAQEVAKPPAAAAPTVPSPPSPPPPVAASTVVVEIPAHWKNLSVAKRLALAAEISGQEIVDKEAADAVIAAEVARRSV